MEPENLPFVVFKKCECEEFRDEYIPNFFYSLLVLELCEYNYGIDSKNIYVDETIPCKKYLNRILKVLGAPKNLPTIGSLIARIDKLDVATVAKHKLFEKISLLTVKYNGILQSKICGGESIIRGREFLTKSILNNNTHQALKIGFEIFKLRHFSKILTNNLKVQLMNIAVEKIGPANIPLVSEVLDICLNYEIDANNLYEMIVALSSSAKTDIVTLVSRIYNYRSAKIANKLGLNVDLESRESDKEIINSDELWNNSNNIRPYLNIMLERVRQRDRNAFGWADIFFSKISKSETEFLDSENSEIIFWKALNCVTCPKNDKVYRKILVLLEKAFFTIPDNTHFWKLALFLAIDSPKIPQDSLSTKYRSLSYYQFGKYGLFSLATSDSNIYKDLRFVDKTLDRISKALCP